MEQPQTPWAILANPAAGSGAVTKSRASLEKYMGELGIPFTYCETQRPGHASELVADHVLKGYRRFASFGGDGTHHEVVNGMYRQQSVPFEDLLFAALPAGTGNDWIRQHGIPGDLHGAVRVLTSFKVAKQVLGVAAFHNSDGEEQTRAFLNVAGAAYDADVAQDVSRVSRRSSLVYLLRGLQNLVNYKGRDCTVKYDDQQWKGRIFTLHAGICRFSGGGMQFVPHASPGGPGLAMTILPFRSMAVLLRHIPRLYNGRIAGFPGSITDTCREIGLDADVPVGLEADGEFLGYSPFKLMEAAEKLHFACPKGK